MLVSMNAGTASAERRRPAKFGAPKIGRSAEKRPCGLHAPAHDSQARRTVALCAESGFTFIDLLFVVSIMGLLSTIAVPGLMRARGAAQSSSALGTLRVINSAELSYAITCGLGFYAPDLPTLGKRPPGAIDAFLSSDLSSGASVIKTGYNFSVAGTGVAGAPATCNGLGVGQAAPGYAAVADPLDVSPPTRYFGTNADGMIYEDAKTYSATMPESGVPPSGKPLQ